MVQSLQGKRKAEGTLRKGKSKLEKLSNLNWMV